MYNLPYYKEDNEKEINAFMLNYPFAFLSGCDSANRPVATQIPLFLEEREGRKYLRGHIMRNTDHHLAFEHNRNVLAIFTGKNAYVSGTWYSNPHTPSTWNYMSVHAKGEITFLGGEELVKMLRMTSLHFENKNDESPTVYDNLPQEMMHRLMKAIVAFEIEVTEIDTVFKLSQDRDLASYKNIIQQLKQHDADSQVIAKEMEKRIDQLFKSS